MTDRPLVLISSDSLDRVVRLVEALLVVASQPLSAEELASAAGVGVELVGDALEQLAERFSEGRSGIVLEHVAGGYAFAAAREAAAACASLFDRPAGRGLSQAALETLAVVAYLGPCTRPEIARIRGVNVDGVVTGLLQRGMLAEDGRESAGGGGVRYRTTPLFERVFGLSSLAELPRIDDLAADTEALRERLESVAERRGT